MGTGGRRGPTLTRNHLLIADALVEAAPEFLAAVPGDVVVADVIQRNVAHCRGTDIALRPQATGSRSGGRAAVGLGGRFSRSLNHVSWESHFETKICNELNF